MSEELELTIDSEMVGRIDKQLGHHFDQFSRSQIQHWIEDGHVLVNGKQVKPKYKLLVGDHIQIIPEEPQKIDLTPENIPLDIVYEDDNVLFINKKTRVRPLFFNLLILLHRCSKKVLLHLLRFPLS